MAYENLIAEARQFYAALQVNNTKAWWQDNRATYDDILKPQALALLEELAPALAALSDAPIKTKLYRPHRDVRFSKDKTPYKIHIHMMWQMDDPDLPQNPVYFFGIGLDYVTAGVGIPSFDKPVLTNWRKMLDLDTDRMLGIIATAQRAGFSLREPALKRVPSPYPQDHAAATLLRHKGLIATQELGTPTDLPAAIQTALTQGAPINQMLASIAAA